MKAIAVKPSTREVGIVDHAEPTLVHRNDVKLKMLDVGVCGTDREICAFDYGTPPFGSERLVIGHESLGQVLELGPDVVGIREGDLVVPMVRRPCAHADCAACSSGRQDFCYTGEFRERGIKECHGFMTEYVVDDASYMNVVPRELRDVAVLVEPLTIAEKALEQLAQVQLRLPWVVSKEPGAPIGAGHKAVVLGAGPVGLLGAMALLVNGFETYVYSRSRKPNDKADLVESLGAKYVASEEVDGNGLAKAVGNIDLVYEAVGASQISFEVMKVLGTNGVFIFTGVPGRKAPIQVDTDLLMRNLVLKNQVVFGTVNAGKQTFQHAIRDLGTFVERFPKAVSALITGRFPVEAHRELLLGRATGIKNVIQFAEPA
ncbi:MAG: glucose 1-dehydrogenase [bacterium]